MKLLTKNFKTHTARQFVESFDEAANTIYFVAAHKSTPFTDDNDPPAPINSINETSYKLFDDMLFGKHVGPDDVRHMIRNVPWVSGTTYAMYDDIDADLGDKNFYVVSDESSNYHVFKCLDNNGGAVSTDKPLYSQTSPEDEIYKTNDGYQWKYMYKITQSEYSKFATSDYIPFIEDTDVTANAVSGSIETIILNEGGVNYRSYATGKMKEISVAGNNLIHGLSGEEFSDYLITVDDISGFVEEKVNSLNTSGKTASGVIISLFEDTNTLRITNTTEQFTPTSTVNGVSSNTSATITSVDRLTTELSANTDFYKNNSFYVRSGRGAGQLRTITEYIVTGDERRVLLNEPFNVLPDTTSVYEIGPRVFISGDGRNAGAVATVNPTTNSIHDIEIINSGYGYTYADIEIVANTGLLDTETGASITTTSAQARAIISPNGGHGSDVINELDANKVGIGVTFEGDENGHISADNDFRKISILKEPLMANVEITLASSSASSFTAGEVVLQANTGAYGTISNREGDTIRLTDVRGFFETGNSTVNYVTGLTSTETESVTAVDKDMTLFDQRQVYQVEVTYLGPENTGFLEDEMVIQSGLLSIPTGLVRLSIDDSAYLYVDGETVTQANTGATGIITARYNNVIELSNIDGTFRTGNNSINYITGGTSSTSSAVEFVDSSALANATGYVHSLNFNGANTTVMGLTDVKGNFSVSDSASGTINSFVGNTSKAVATLTGRVYDENYLVDNSGEFLYVENFAPIERQDSQSEKLKLIIEF